MYSWLFRKLPGPTPVRVTITLVLVAVVVLLLMEVLFPAVETYMPYTSVAVD